MALPLRPLLIVAVLLLALTSDEAFLRKGQSSSQRSVYTWLSLSSLVGTDSAHLKLQEAFEKRLGDEEGGSVDVVSIAEKEGYGIVTAFVNKTTNTTLVATQGILASSLVRLEQFGLHICGRNFSDCGDDITATQVIYDLRLESSLHQLEELYLSQRLLLLSKDFPPKEPFIDPPPLNNGGGAKSNEALERKFEGKLLGNARRLLAMKQEDEANLLADTINEETRKVRDFLFSHPNYSPLWHNSRERSANETLVQVKEFLIWFRENFPYYYNACLNESCGDPSNKSNEYLGSVYPRPDELEHKAGVTELTVCACCRRVTRFPRYNALPKMLQTRRGRCGEYSVLAMVMLEVMGYQCRWVVDWADHVWCEVRLPGSAGDAHRWAHVDPCEASVDEPLIYQGWGKNATFIFAIAKSGRQAGVDDVTSTYTTVGADEVDRRREQAGVNSSVVAQAVIKANRLWQ